MSMPLPAHVLALYEVRHRLREPRLWCQGHTTIGVAHCIVGAISQLPASVRTRLETIEALKRVAATDDDLTLWNDTVGRTHAEVIALIDKTIEQETRVEPS